MLRVVILFFFKASLKSYLSFIFNLINYNKKEFNILLTEMLVFLLLWWKWGNLMKEIKILEIKKELSKKTMTCFIWS